MREVDQPGRYQPGLDGRVAGFMHKPAAYNDKRARSGERGACGLKSLMWIAIMGSFIYVCIQAGPYFVHEYEFTDALQTMARFASVNRQTPDDIRAATLKEAFKDEIPLKPQDIKVTANSGNVKIEAAYSVTVNLQIYQWQINFNPSATNNALY
jgi:hypothetical protein